MPTLQPIVNMEELREYVYSVIYQHGELLPGAFPTAERVLRRRGRACGIQFLVQGPRATSFSAIWDADQNQILFYDCRGGRFENTHLVGAGIELAAA